MFTGLVQAMGRVAEIGPIAAGFRLSIDASGWQHRPRPGDSVCVSGCCLTVAGEVGPGNLLTFDVVPETLQKTSLGRLTVGSRVNLEHSVTPTTLMGGHIVQGHVDGVGVVAAIQTKGEWRVRVRPPGDMAPYFVPKGSVTVDGVSLTLAETGPDWFEVALIPTTLAQTTLGELKVGGTVNLEADIIAKTVVGYLNRFQNR